MQTIPQRAFGPDIEAMSQISAIDDDRITAFGLLLESQAALVKVFDQQLRDECGLSLRWFEVLLRLARSPGSCLPAGELGRSISLTSGATTRRIDRLVEAGLVERRTGTTDHRIVEVALTDDGRHRLAEALPVHLAGLDRHLAGVLSPEQIPTLSTALRQLRDQFSEPDGTTTSDAG